MKIYSSHFFELCVVFLLFLVISFFSAMSLHAQANCDRAQANEPSAQTENLEESAEDWGGYCEKTPTWLMENVSDLVLNGTSLRCALTGGSEPYSNIHCYRNLLAEPPTTTFELDLAFRFSPTSCGNEGSPSAIQALEFTMNKWDAGLRYEWALQWRNVGDGAPQWRYWNPDPALQDRWVPIPIDITDVCLQGSQWHTLTLNGDIVDGQTHYQSFTLNGQTYELDITVEPIAEAAPDKLAVAIQLDGNSTNTPYDVFIDNVSFTRGTGEDEPPPMNPTVVIRDDANLRECASTVCTAATSLQAGAMHSLENIIFDGECINGNCIWYEIEFFGVQRFVHSAAATIADISIAQSSGVCAATGDTAIPVTFYVPEGHTAYIASAGLGTTSENIQFTPFLTTIVGPFEGILHVHVGIYCDAAVNGSPYEVLAFNEASRACTNCTPIELPRDLAQFGSSEPDSSGNGSVSTSTPPQQTFSCTNTGDATVEVQFNLPAGYMAAINSDGIGTSSESRIFGGYTTIITGPFADTLYIHVGVYCVGAAIGSVDEATARQTVSDACAGRVCGEINLPADIAEIGG